MRRNFIDDYSYDDYDDEIIDNATDNGVDDDYYDIGDMTLYAHYREVKAIMVKSISNDVTNISMSYTGSYPANVEYSYDGLNWYNIWNNNNLTISLSEWYSKYVYFRGYNPNGFSRDWSKYTKFNITNGQCDVLGNIMYLKDYNQELNTVGNCEFTYLFFGCNSIVKANNLTLPATTLAYCCYVSMFDGCTSLATAPELPATALAQYCYQSMFKDCGSLIVAPTLQSTVLEDACYRYMFQGCTSLTTAPELPATTLTQGCYNSMFGGCSSLKTAHSILPATNLSNSPYCYNGMFQNCTSLTTAPELPATELAEGCYSYMFMGCRSLTTAPELPATTLTNYCYNSMFYNCSSLNYIKCFAVNGINQNGSTDSWVYNVPTVSTSTFVKHPDATDWTTDSNGIPTNWTVKDAVIE